jgi:hypothetical protein
MPRGIGSCREHDGTVAELLMFPRAARYIENVAPYVGYDDGNENPTGAGPVGQCPKELRGYAATAGEKKGRRSPQSHATRQLR